jgi:hypothetical protein
LVPVALQVCRERRVVAPRGEIPRTLRALRSGARGTRTPDLLGAIQRRLGPRGFEGLRIARDHGWFGFDTDDEDAVARVLTYPFRTRQGGGPTRESFTVPLLIVRFLSTWGSSTPDLVTVADGRRQIGSTPAGGDP